MRAFVLTIAIFVFIGLNENYAQEFQSTFEQQGDLIKGTFYYEDGGIKQEGTYKDGKLHGKWISFGQDGKKTALAHYHRGEKVGKWFFWSTDLLTEIDYENSKIAAVRNYTLISSLVNQN